MDSLENLLAQLRQNNLKITPQRRLILEILCDERSHPTADEIYQRVLAGMPDVSRTTVYNTLRELVALGVLTEVQELGARGLRYDTNPRQHHHLFCTCCHALKDLACDFPDITLAPEETAGYHITHHQVTFYGLCPDCQREEIHNS